MSQKNNRGIEEDLIGLSCESFRVDASEIQSSKLLASIPGWDSLRFMHLIVQVEEKMKIKFEVYEISELKTWQEFVDLVSSKAEE